MLKEALFYEALDEEKLKCNLCPHNCILGDLERGICQVRRNTNGSLIAENFGVCSTINFEPIEKKPLYHFRSGERILSIGSIGCNFQCDFCQNCEISQSSVDQYLHCQMQDPEDLVEMATDYPENIGVAFTYNEPTVYFEYMLETAQLCKQTGLQVVVVSNGFINEIPLQQLLPFVDAFNIDLKGYSNGFYNGLNGRIEPVKNSLQLISRAEKHLEVTFLLIPGANDDLTEFSTMTRWISEELGRETVLHISRYFPAYKKTEEQTSLSLLFDFSEAAKQVLDYVYLGNAKEAEDQNTICSMCGQIVITRVGHHAQLNGVDKLGNCIYCGNNILTT